MCSPFGYARPGALRHPNARAGRTGIEPEMLERVFQPLYTTRADGTGLGLTIARRIVEQHRGDIEIESQPGQGTTVRVTFPR